MANLCVRFDLWRGSIRTDREKRSIENVEEKLTARTSALKARSGRNAEEAILRFVTLYASQKKKKKKKKVLVALALD